jgi:hypothetical protein
MAGYSLMTGGKLTSIIGEYTTVGNKDITHINNILHPVMFQVGHSLKLKSASDLSKRSTESNG